MVTCNCGRQTATYTLDYTQYVGLNRQEAREKEEEGNRHLREWLAKRCSVCTPVATTNVG